jgi:hypothetical protein
MPLTFEAPRNLEPRSRGPWPTNWMSDQAQKDQIQRTVKIMLEQDGLTLESQSIVFNDAPLPITDRRMRYVMGTTVSVRNQMP